MSARTDDDLTHYMKAVSRLRMQLADVLSSGDFSACSPEKQVEFAALAVELGLARVGGRSAFPGLSEEAIGREVVREAAKDRTGTVCLRVSPSLAEIAYRLRESALVDAVDVEPDWAADAWEIIVE